MILLEDRLNHTVILRFGDYFLLIFSWLLAYWIRFQLLGGAQPGLFGFFLTTSWAVALLGHHFLSRAKAYEVSFNHGFKRKFLPVFKGMCLSIFVFICLLYFFKMEKLSRLTLAFYFLNSIFFLTIFRSLFALWCSGKAGGKSANREKVVLVGNAPSLAKIVELVNDGFESTLSLQCWVDAPSEYRDKMSGTLCCPNSNLEDVLKQYEVEGLIVGYTSDKQAEANLVLKNYHSRILSLKILPQLPYDYLGLGFLTIGDMPVLTLNSPQISTLDYFIKRLFDIVVAGLGLVFLSPFLLVVGLAIKLTSRGPIFFRQNRVTLDGRSFEMWKFRSMKSGAEQKTGAVWAVENDPRRTRIGVFLRQTSIDELPQLLNVVLGDMSLVGPRPERPIFIEKFKNEIPGYMLRHKMRAGITGWAQVNGWRGNTALSSRIEHDIFYIRNWSMLFDLKILFLTFWKGNLKKNAY